MTKNFDLPEYARSVGLSDGYFNTPADRFYSGYKKTKKILTEQPTITVEELNIHKLNGTDYDYGVLYALTEAGKLKIPREKFLPYQESLQKIETKLSDEQFLSYGHVNPATGVILGTGASAFGVLGLNALRSNLSTKELQATGQLTKDRLKYIQSDKYINKEFNELAGETPEYFRKHNLHKDFENGGNKVLKDYMRTTYIPDVGVDGLKDSKPYFKHFAHKFIKSELGNKYNLGEISYLSDSHFNPVDKTLTVRPQLSLLAHEAGHAHIDQNIEKISPWLAKYRPSIMKALPGVAVGGIGLASSEDSVLRENAGYIAAAASAPLIAEEGYATWKGTKMMDKFVNNYQPDWKTSPHIPDFTKTWAGVNNARLKLSPAFGTYVLTAIPAILAGSYLQSSANKTKEHRDGRKKYFTETLLDKQI